MKPSEFCRREVQWLPPGQTLQPEFNTDEITSPEYIEKLGCGIGLAKKRGWRKNEDIHSLHEGPLVANTVIDRHLSRVMKPVNCQLTI